MTNQPDEQKKVPACAGTAILQRLILWVGKEAHLLGADIEVEVSSILAKLRVKR